jgi:transcriptional regulator with XRE-family HTH domain
MNAINQYLTETNTTQTEFGKKLGVGQSMVRQWATNKRPVSLDRALDIEEEFGINAEEINPQVAVISERLRQRLEKRNCANNL